MESFREMQVHLIRYFFGERRGALLLLVLGGAALLAAVLLLAFGGPGLARGLAVPLGALALLELGVGWTVFSRTDARMAALSRQLESDPRGFREAEIVRMRKVVAGFRVYKLTEIVVVAGGFALAVAYRGRPALFAAGAGCILQGLLLLVMEVAAEERARQYVAALRRLLDDRPASSPL